MGTEKPRTDESKRCPGYWGGMSDEKLQTLLLEGIVVDLKSEDWLEFTYLVFRNRIRRMFPGAKRQLPTFSQLNHQDPPLIVRMKDGRIEWYAEADISKYMER